MSSTLFKNSGLKISFKALSILLLSTVFLANPIEFVFKLEPLYYIVKEAKELFHIVQPEPVGALLVAIGAILFVLAWKKTNITMIDSNDTNAMRKKGKS